jgi:hypothetical protein
LFTVAEVSGDLQRASLPSPSSLSPPRHSERNAVESKKPVAANTGHHQ